MKRTVISCILTFCLLAALVPGTSLAAESAVWDGTVAEAFAGGTGTKEDPYQIANGAQLALLSKQADDGDTNDVFYVLTSDIDLGGKPWTPIGTYRWAYCTFEGNFDGRGHSVTNLYVDAEVTYADTDRTYAGLFGLVDLGTIQNLSVSGTVQSANSAHPYVGGVAGFIGGTRWDSETGLESGSRIAGCSFSGSVTVQAEGEDERDGLAVPYAGGIVGCVGSKSQVLNCRNAGTVTCSSSHMVYAGGIAGQSGLRVSGCGNSGKVTGISARETTLGVTWGGGWENYTGGIVGNHPAEFQSAYIEHCRNTGNVTAKGGAIHVGGIAGLSVLGYGGNYYATVRSCYNTGAVSGDSPLPTAVGGVVGASSSDTQILSCYSTGSVTGGDGDMVGGILGQMTVYYARVNMEACYAAGPVSGGADAKTGGILGKCYIRDEEFDKSRNIKLTGCFYLRTEDVNAGLEGVGDARSWSDLFQDIIPLSADAFGDLSNFSDWDQDVWKMVKGLDPDVCSVTARPVLVNPDESDRTIPVTGVALDQTELTLVAGETAALAASVLPPDATEQTILWGTSAPEIAEVDENGVVTAVAEGTARIAAAAGDWWAVCTVTVVPARVVAFSVTEEGAAALSVLSGCDGTAVLAAYHWDGRCQAVKVLPLKTGEKASVTLDLPDETGPVRAFVLDSQGRPLTEAVDLW